MIFDTDSAAIVIDNGSDQIKGGIAGEDAPRSSFRTLIGKPKMLGLMVILSNYSFLIRLAKN